MLPVEQCPVSSPLINRAISAFWQLGREGKVPDGIREIEFFVDAEDTELLIEASCEPGTPITGWADAARRTLQEITGIVVYKTAASREGKPVEPKKIATSGPEEIKYKVDGVPYRVNRHLINELVSIVCQRDGDDVALDLYAGVGLFSTFLSRNFAQVIAVESSQTSHLDLLHNSPANVKAVRATTADFLRSAKGKLRPDLVVLDPPRSGLGETVVQSLVGLGAHRMTYISCDPATASRDLVGLLSAGYRIEQAHLVDLFPQTFHMETIVELRLR